MAFVTGHEDPEKKTPVVKWEKLFDAIDTAVIYMGTEKLEIIIEKIKGGNINEKTKVAVIENGTLKNQRVIIGEIDSIVSKVKRENIKPPAIVIIGDTVNLNGNIDWYSQRRSILTNINSGINIGRCNKHCSHQRRNR